MNKSYIVSGVLFGDEGKGTLSDYLASQYNLKENIRYNGGSHASHTVINNKVKHKFSQLGSSQLNPGVRTLLSDNTVVNLFNIITEAQCFSKESSIPIDEILRRIFVDCNALVVTPYHSLINKVRELTDQNNRTGSVGTGVSEVNKVKEITGIDLKVSDLLNDEGQRKILELYYYTRDYVQERINKISNKQYSHYLDVKELEFLTSRHNRHYIVDCYKNLIDSDLLNIISGIEAFHQNQDILFEGSQAVLIDKDYGIKPNTTSLDTTNLYGTKMAKKLNTEIHRIGCISAIASRHGIGVFPTYDKYLQTRIFDENQMSSYYQGIPRYGWLDTVLLKYSLKVSPNDELFMSGLDRLTNLEKIKICNEYLYIGKVDDEFIKTFNITKDKNRIFISGIKDNSPHLRKYLAKCIPIYKEFKSFNTDIGSIKNYDDLPDECLEFIDYVSASLKTPISIVGVGENRQQKLKRKVKTL